MRETFMAEALAPLDHTDLTDQTYSVIKDQILRRQLIPGERISVDEVAQALGVSRTPVTDALKRLANEDLVDIRPRIGTFVSELTARDVEELFDVRMAVELFAADHIIQHDLIDAFFARIQDPMAIMRKATVDDEYGDYRAFIEGDRQLHFSLVAMTENQKLHHVYSGLNVHIHVARAHYLSSVENARQAHQEHEAILAAFKKADQELVRRTLGMHISNVKNLILELLDERGGKL
jgi:DNA-binding GntR family transcriptional regulator